MIGSAVPMQRAVVEAVVYGEGNLRSIRLIGGGQPSTGRPTSGPERLEMSERCWSLPIGGRKPQAAPRRFRQISPQVTCAVSACDAGYGRRRFRAIAPRTLGQNSRNPLLAMRPTKPNPIRVRACWVLASLDTRQVFDRKSLPAIAVYRAYAGMVPPSALRARNVILTIWRTRAANGCPAARGYRGSSPHTAPRLASIALPVTTPVRRMP